MLARDTNHPPWTTHQTLKGKLTKLQWILIPYRSTSVTASCWCQLVHTTPAVNITYCLGIRQRACHATTASIVAAEPEHICAQAAMRCVLTALLIVASAPSLQSSPCRGCSSCLSLLVLLAGGLVCWPMCSLASHQTVPAGNNSDQTLEA